MSIPILYLITELSVGGAQTVLYELLKNIDRNRFDPAVACLFNGNGKTAESIRQLNIPVFDAGMRHKADFEALRRLYLIIRNSHPVILHSHLFHANQTARMLGRLAGSPVIVNCEHTSAMESEWRYRVNRLTIGLADRVVAVSASVQEFCTVHIHLPASKLVLIRNGIAIPDKTLPTQRESRQMFNLPEEVDLIGTIGRLDPIKGYSYLLEALKQIDPDACLVIVGDGPEREHLQAHACRLGIKERVFWMGSVQDIWSILPAFDLFVLPSLREGLPVTLLEAMAAGLPVVATQVGGVPEVILDGITGILLPAGNPQALAEAIQRLLTKPGLCMEMGRSGRERVRDDFSVEQMVQKTQALYEDLLVEKGFNR